VIYFTVLHLQPFHSDQMNRMNTCTDNVMMRTLYLNKLLAWLNGFNSQCAD